MWDVIWLQEGIFSSMVSHVPYNDVVSLADQMTLETKLGGISWKDRREMYLKYPKRFFN